MTLKITTAIVSVSILAASSYAIANENKAEINSNIEINIEQLPDSGIVELSGTVSEIEGTKEFTLTDSKGETIDIKSANDLSLKIGDKVDVNGVVKESLLGLGKKSIKASSVKVDASATIAADVKEETTEAVEAVKEKTIDAVETTEEKTKGILGNVKKVGSNIVSGTKKVSSNIVSNTKEVGSDVVSGTKKLGSNIATGTKNTVSAVSNKVSTSISDLKSSGDVEIKGTVDSINDNGFVLKDNSGQTVNISSTKELKVKKGDTVMVHGDIESSVESGINKIISNDVKVISK